MRLPFVGKRKKTKKQKKQLKRRPAGFRFGGGSAFRDYSLIFIVVFLLAFGLVMLYSTSSYVAAVRYSGDSSYYFARQLKFTLGGLVVMFVFSFIPYSFWRYTAPYAYVFAILMILATIPFGTAANGATRWLIVSGVSIQPAEIAKVAIITFTACLIENLGRRVNTFWGFIGPIGAAGFVAVLIWKITDNLSSAIIVGAIVMGMLYVACPHHKRFIVIFGGAAATALLWVYNTVRMADQSNMGFRESHILAWLYPQEYASGRAYQTIQALYAIGSGGIFGKGLGNSLQKLGHVPELQNDMIFSIICEELGLFGAISILLMYVLLIWRFMVIASNADDLYGAMLVVGVMTHIAVQVVLNIAVVTNSIPNTGVTLPFISYGGSSVMILLAEIGIVLSVAKGSGKRFSFKS